MRFKGYAEKWDEWIDTEMELHKIMEVGSYSPAYGWAKNSQF